MNQRLLITTETLTSCRGEHKEPYQVAALYEDDRMIEVTAAPLTGENRGILGNIYVARVQNVVSNLNAAFVEIAKGVLCYLPLEHFHNPVFTKKLSKKKEIAAGDELLVQVTREAVKTKAPVVSTGLSFSGEYLVLTSADHKIGVSSKLTKDVRRHLQELGISLRDRIPDALPFGLILRTNAAKADARMLQAELSQLYDHYQEVVTTAHTRSLYSCLLREQPFYLKMLKDLHKKDLMEVVTDDAAIYEQLQDAVHGTYELRFYEDSMLPLSRLYNISGQIEAALKERVWLKSGANIIIQPTEALTVIDVNSGKNVAKNEKTLNHYRINLEAAREIARQLRLRNISGIILVDYIDLKDEQLNQSLMAEFRDALKKDPVPTQLIDMTKLGLVELTRKKIRKSLREMLR